MEHKYSSKTHAEIEHVLARIQSFKELFSINIQYYIDGWAIFLDEKRSYPRRIVIFKSYDNNLFFIKSFEVNPENDKKQEMNELYSIENLDIIEKLMRELKEIIYGKDIMNYTSENYFNKYSK